jgi:carbonic anhydrase
MTLDIIYRFDPHAHVRGDVVDTGDEVLRHLAAGNDRFATMVATMQSIAESPRKHEMVIPIHPFSLGIPIAPGMSPPHAPFALVLGCSDARAPIEHILDCSSNDLFVVRVAGNVLGIECLGSVDYAVGNLQDSLRAVVVLGHTGCGAVTAAVDVYMSPAEFTDIASSHAVRTLLDRLMLAVRGSANALERHLGSSAKQSPNYRKLLIETAVYMNAAVTAWDLQREVNSFGAQKLAVVYSVYDIERSRISAIPLGNQLPQTEPTPFARSGTNKEDFSIIADNVVKALLSRQEYQDPGC